MASGVSLFYFMHYDKNVLSTFLLPTFAFMNNYSLLFFLMNKKSSEHERIPVDQISYINTYLYD